MTEQEYDKRMTNSKYKEIPVTAGADKKPYVFISYKSDSWELVLTEIVYKLVKEYGLRVYFDKSFNDNNNVWTSQFMENMRSPYCKAVVAFVDNQYYLSYATLLELMYSRTVKATEGKRKFDVIPVNLEKIITPSTEVGSEDTGLGVRNASNGVINPNAKTEKEKFDKTFKELVSRKIFDEGSDCKAVYSYDPDADKDKDKQENLIMLSKISCWTIMSELFGIIKVNENPYKPNKEFYDYLVETIKSVAPDVFDEPGEWDEKIGRNDVENAGAVSDKKEATSEVRGEDLKQADNYPSTKGTGGRGKISYAWAGDEYRQYLSMREGDREFEFVEANTIGIRGFYQFMLWFMVNKGVQIGPMVYGIDKNDVDKSGNNRGTRKWKDVLCVEKLTEDTKQLIGAEEFSDKYMTDADGDLCVYVGGNLAKDNRTFAKMFDALAAVEDISQYSIYYGGAQNN